MNLAQIRHDTPASADLIHLNNAGAALQPTAVTEAVDHYLAYEARHGGYESQSAYAELLATFYPNAARLLGGESRNWAFCYSSTDAYARALSAIPFKAGDVILTTNDDYISNQFAFLSLQKRFGIRIVRADDLSGGGVRPEHLIELAYQLHPVLIAVTHVPTNAGRVQPVELFGPVARAVGAWYLVDACQSVGQMPVDAVAIGADFLTATGRKFLRGPRGTGLLYVSDRVLEAGLEPLFIDMRGADWVADDAYHPQATARRFEQWESSPALVLGLSAALDYAATVGAAAMHERNQLLMHKLWHGLSAVPGLRLLDDAMPEASLLLFTLPGQQPDALQATLRQHRVNFSMSYTNYALIDWERKGVDWALRFSPHYYNSEEEIDVAIGLCRDRSVGAA